MLKKQLFTLFLVLMAAMTAQAQPANDNCANAIPLCGDATITGSTATATIDGPGTDCGGGSVAPDVWYTISGTGGNITVSLCGSSYDTQIDLYTGTCGTLTNIGGCNDDFCGLQSQVTWSSTLGITYYIRVHGFAGGTGNYTLNYSPTTTCGPSLCNLGATLNGTTDVCVGGVIGLVATGGNQYQWSGPNGYTNTGGSITRSPANVTMSGTYTVTITNNDCVDILSTEVTVHPKPSATLSGATSVCSGGTIMLTAPSGAATYQWSGPGGFSSNTGDVNTLVRTPANTTMSGVYKVTVTNAGGCTATASRTITVSAPTNATITGAASFCAGSMITLTATTPGVDYQWSGPGGYTQSGATLSRGPATSAMAGLYKVTVTNASGCISTASKTITISAVPNVAITNNSNCTRIWLIASGGNSYSWSGPGYSGTGNTVLRNPATYAMYGTYTVTVTGSGGCTASASITVSSCGGGDEKNGGVLIEETLKAFPNPTNGISTVTFTALTNESTKLSVYGIDGKEIVELFNGTTETDTTYQLEFDATGLPTAIYFAILRRADGSTEQTRILVTK